MCIFLYIYYEEVQLHSKLILFREICKNINQQLYSTKVSMSALNTEMDGSGEVLDAPNCNCPADCTETVYFSEKSQATLRTDSTIFEKVKKNPYYQQLIVGIENANK